MKSKFMTFLAVILTAIAVYLVASQYYEKQITKAYGQGYDDAQWKTIDTLSKKPDEPPVMEQSTSNWISIEHQPYETGYCDGYNDGYIRALNDFNVEHGDIQRFEIQ